MRYVEVGGERLSAVGLGTWQFGSREWGYGNAYAEHTAGDIVKRALECGINLFDTAEIYGFGKSERILGEAIGDARGQAFIASKVFPVAPTPSIIRWRAGGSARRLAMIEIDLFQIHWPNPVVPLNWQMKGMRQLRDRGLIRHIGVSNFSLQRWQEAEKRLGGDVLSNQVQFSLVDQRPIKSGMTTWAADNGRIILAYSPLAQGLLSANYTHDNRPGGMRARQAAFRPENIAKAGKLFSVLKSVAAVHEATPAQVALAWLISHPNVIAIPGASSVAQLERNAEAADLELSADEIAELGSAADDYKRLMAAGSKR
jgi:aryl-alcohol dehydrogenase-like predicted oxidoreductase